MERLPPQNKSNDEKDKHLFDTEKVVHSKDDGKPINDLLSEHFKNWGKSRVTGKQRTSSANGYKTSASCEPGYARGHNIRDPKYVEEKKHIDPEGLHKVYTDMGPIEKCYKEIFSEALEEYNSKQIRKSRKINNYLTHILQDKRRGTMKKNVKVDNSRKPSYEFIFEIGNRDHQIDRKLAIEILEKFCNEWIPEHYPNLKPICVSLHADEYTIDPVTNERIDSAPHIHFDFIPIAHRLSEEEKEDFENWKKELKEQEKAECKAKGIKFDSEEFENRDWAFERAKRYGKSEMKGLSLQSSLSGACAEMGFRTQGINTAQIQMEKAVRLDFLDLLESYGIEVDRTTAVNPEKKVKIDVYKAREDAKKIWKEVQKQKAENELKEKELENREKAVEHLESEKNDLDNRESEVKKREEKVAPYTERIDTLVRDEATLKIQKDKADKRDIELDDKKEKLDTKEKVLDTREKSLDNRENNLDEYEKTIDKKKEEAEQIEKQNKTITELNQENARKNDINSKEINNKFEQFAPLEEKYKKYSATVNATEKITVDVKAIGNQLKSELSNSSGSWHDKIEYAINNFTERCQKIVIKCQDAIRGFMNFLKGKTPQDFRNLADDMERNETKTFEEYEHKWNSESLDWQIEERKRKLALKTVQKRSYEVER